MKIVWTEHKNNSLVARKKVGRGSEYLVGLREQDVDPIQQWCVDHNCGKRMSFDTFQFKTQAEKTMFLLVWG